jgi:hypothetical protein
MFGAKDVLPKLQLNIKIANLLCTVDILYYNDIVLQSYSSLFCVLGVTVSRV